MKFAPGISIAIIVCSIVVYLSVEKDRNNLTKSNFVSTLYEGSSNIFGNGTETEALRKVFPLKKSDTGLHKPKKPDPKIEISEVFPDPHGKDYGKEFIELVNRSTARENLEGWSIVHETNNSSTTLVNIGSSRDDETFLKGGGIYLIGFNRYTGAPSPNATRSVAIANKAAIIKLINSESKVVDSIKYEAVVGGKSMTRNGHGNLTLQNPTPGK